MDRFGGEWSQVGGQDYNVLMKVPGGAGDLGADFKADRDGAGASDATGLG
jgi:hypothetical protein